MRGMRGLAENIQQRFSQIEPRVREAEAVQRAVTDKNPFLVEGEGGDLLLLYNSSPRAVSVVHGLNGNLVFDPERTVACALADAKRRVDVVLSTMQFGLVTFAEETHCARFACQLSKPRFTCRCACRVLMHQQRFADTAVAVYQRYFVFRDEGRHLPLPGGDGSPFPSCRVNPGQ